MTTRQQTRATFPSGYVFALFGLVAIVAIGFAVVSMNSDGSSGTTSSNTNSALVPSLPSADLSPAGQLNAEMQQHEDLTTNEFGPAAAPVSVPAKTLEEQIADAIAEHENGLGAQMGW